MSESDIVIGIDLGTTNSCVAVPEAAYIPRRDELLAKGRLVTFEDTHGAYVVTDPYGAAFTPSVVWVSEAGEPLVGVEAKQMAEAAAGPPPAMFFKRLMGTSEQVIAGHARLSPVEASAHVLRYLKAMTEQALGVAVHRAVVTVPAFFELTAKQATTEAGELAGLEVVDTLLEPVAAALVYAQLSQEPGRPFLVYDLGGGTFDASVVVHDPRPECKAFDGDRNLGGYDFDRAIVNWMIARLGETYDVRGLDIEDWADRAVFFSMLIHAEAEKHNLSLPEPRGLRTTIAYTTGKDRSGRLMNVRLPLTRADFEGLIGDLVDRTVTCCDRALEEAGVAPASLGDIVMVGGSSRIPLVRERLRRRFGKEPLLVEPDLCVALGAALKATTVAARVGVLLVDHLPAVIDLDTIDVSGGVDPQAGLTAVAGLEVSLRSADGTISRRTATNEQGRFLFENVPLEPEAENRLTVSLRSDGVELASHAVTVVQGEARAEEEIPPETGDVLAHPVSVQVVGGFATLADAGQLLPYRSRLRLATAYQLSGIEVRLFDGYKPIGTVVIPELAVTVSADTDVFLEVIFNRGWTLDALLTVPAAGAEARALIDLPPSPLLRWDEIGTRLLAAVAAWRERKEVAAPDELLRKGLEIEALIADTERLLNERQDRGHADDTLKQLETLVSSIPVVQVLDPPKDQFDQALRDAHEHIERLERERPREPAHHYRARLRAIETHGLGAFQARNLADWQLANHNLEELVYRLSELLGLVGPTPAAQLLVLVGQEVADIEAALRNAGMHDQFAAELREIDRQLTAIDLDDEERARRSIATVYQDRVVALRVRIKQVAEEQATRGRGPQVKLPDSAMQASGRFFRPG